MGVSTVHTKRNTKTQIAQGAPLEKVNPNTWQLEKLASPPKPLPNTMGSPGLFQGTQQTLSTSLVVNQALFSTRPDLLTHSEHISYCLHGFHIAQRIKDTGLEQNSVVYHNCKHTNK